MRRWTDDHEINLLISGTVLATAFPQACLSKTFQQIHLLNCSLIIEGGIGKSAAATREVHYHQEAKENPQEASPEAAQRLLLVWRTRERLELQQSVGQVVHPEAVGGWVESCPFTLCRLLHPPVRVRLRRTTHAGFAFSLIPCQEVAVCKTARCNLFSGDSLWLTSVGVHH